MNTTTITVSKDDSFEIHFGSWVMGQLASEGWGYSLKEILEKIASNPFVSMALIIHLGRCSAANKSTSLSELSLDDVYAIMDKLGESGANEIVKIRDLFLTSAFGEEVVKLLNQLGDEESKDQEPKKKAVKAKRK